MTKTILNVDPGVCGFTCRIEGCKTKDRAAGVSILESQCEMVNKLSDGIDEVSVKDMFLPLTRNPVFAAAERARCHAACPVPSAVIKTLEIVLGLAVKKDVSFKFDETAK